jgi:hypothetical protein
MKEALTEAFPVFRVELSEDLVGGLLVYWVGLGTEP